MATTAVRPRGRPRKVITKRVAVGVVFDDGMQVRIIRAMLRLSRKAMARRLGVNHSTIVNWELYGRAPQAANKKELEALCRHSGIAFTSFGYPIPADMIALKESA